MFVHLNISEPVTFVLAPHFWAVSTQRQIHKERISRCRCEDVTVVGIDSTLQEFKLERTNLTPSMKDVGSNPTGVFLSLSFLCMSVWISSSLPPQSNNLRFRWIGHSKCPVGVNVNVDESICVLPVNAGWAPAPWALHRMSVWIDGWILETTQCKAILGQVDRKVNLYAFWFLRSIQM